MSKYTNYKEKDIYGLLASVYELFSGIGWKKFRVVCYDDGVSEKAPTNNFYMDFSHFCCLLLDICFWRGFLEKLLVHTYVSFHGKKTTIRVNSTMKYACSWGFFFSFSPLLGNSRPGPNIESRLKMEN